MHRVTRSEGEAECSSPVGTLVRAWHSDPATARAVAEMMRTAWARCGSLVFLVVVAAWLVSGCGGSGDRRSGRQAPARDAPAGDAVPLIVVRQGPKVSAYVQVRLKGHALLFKVDTGAGRAIAMRVVHDHKGGVFETVTAVVSRRTGCSAQLAPVAINAWTTGGVALPPTLALSWTSAALAKPGGEPVDGAIGADVLSGFASVTFDFARKRLILSHTES